MLLLVHHVVLLLIKVSSVRSIGFFVLPGEAVHCINTPFCWLVAVHLLLLRHRWMVAGCAWDVGWEPQLDSMLPNLPAHQF